MKSGDCFDNEPDLLSVEDALALIARRFDVITDPEWVPLTDALDRVLAADLLAPISLPSFDNSAVDGYAVRLVDAGGAVDVMGPAMAGMAPMPTPGQGSALRIFTGAPVPAGVDGVVMQEDVQVLADGRVRLPPSSRAGQNIRRAGEDVDAGAVALPGGRRLRPQDLALAAALGIDRLSVRRLLRVALFSTGDELAEPGQSLPPGGIHDANRPLLRGLLGRLGCEVSDLGILRDQADTIKAALLSAAETHDLILTSGGMSVGAADHVGDAVRSMGVLEFWKLALKPGKPLALGHVGPAAFAGLPGNPVAVLVGFVLLVRPLIQRLSGAMVEPLPLFMARAGFDMVRKPGRQEYLRVRLGTDGVVEGDPLDGSAMLRPLATADALAVLDADVTQVRRGDVLRVLPLGLLGA